MGRWLNRIQQAPAPAAGDEKTPKAPGNNPTEPTEPPSVGCVGMATGAFAEKQMRDKTATPHEVETLLAGLAAAGRRLDTIEPLARMTMLALSQPAAAELAVAFCDAFEVANSERAARAQCRRLLSDPQALAAAKAVWPMLPPQGPDASQPQQPTSRPVVQHVPRWLRLIRERCLLLPEDEGHLRRHLGRLAPGEALALAERYAATWERAAQAEPRPAAGDNAGRRAANRMLRQNPAPAR